MIKAMGEQNISFSRPPGQVPLPPRPPSPSMQQVPSKRSIHESPISLTSVPAKSYQHTDNSSSENWGQSPATSCNGTPRLKQSGTAPGAPAASSLSQRPGGCVFETALIRGRRRMPYSLGIEKLQRVSPNKINDILPEDEESLTRDMRQLFDSLLPTQGISQNRIKFVEKLQKIFNDEWPGHSIRVNVFGSMGNLLCSDYSEVDVCVTTDWKALENVCMIAELLAKRGMDKVVCVPAKVPIVKIRDPEFDIACHINVNNTLALETTRMIRTYVSIDARVRPLAMVIKYWARRRMINDAGVGGTLSSYTWTCMIIGFLQMQDPPVLPVLHQQLDDGLPAAKDNKSKFADDLDKLRGFGDMNKQTLGRLLFSFFRFYAHEFNYSMDALSVRLGSVIPKTNKWKRTVNNMLCIEEPFNTARNLANSADDISFRGLHVEFRRAFELISHAKLDECCEQYVFPKEEERIWQKPVPVPRPVITRGLSQPQSSRGRARSSNIRVKSSNSPMHQSATAYFQAGMQPELSWNVPQDTFSILQALQMQEQALRYQLYAQQQIHYGAPAGVLGDQIMINDQPYMPQTTPLHPEMYMYGSPVMQPLPYFSQPGVDYAWSAPRASIQAPVIYGAPLPPNRNPMPNNSSPFVASSSNLSNNSKAIPNFIPDESADEGTLENNEPLSRDQNAAAIPSFIIDENEEAPREEKQELKATTAEPSNPSTNLLQLLAARLATRKPASRTVASSAVLVNSENESTLNNVKSDEPKANTISTETRGLPNEADATASTIGPQDTISISIGPSHDITQGTITSFRTKSTGVTLPTSATQTNSQRPEHKAEPVHVETRYAAPAQTQIDDEEELEAAQPSEHVDEQNVYSDFIAVASTISADSMQLSPAQKTNIVRRFSSMVSGRLAGLLSVDATSRPSNLGFLGQVEDLLKEFSNTVRSDASNRAHSLGCKSIRVLRREIARELENMLSAEVPLPETLRHLPYIASEAERLYAGQMTFSEKVNDWVDSEVLQGESLRCEKIASEVRGRELRGVDLDTITILGPASVDTLSASDSSDPSSFEVLGLYPDFINDGDISAYLANHAAFDDLVTNVQLLLEKYHCNKMDLIRHRVSDAVRRHRVGRGQGVDISSNHHTAIFDVDWNVQGFLKTQYPLGLEQDLGLCLAFVGQLINAQLTTIEDYFGRVWPRYTFAVLEPLTRSLRGLNESSDKLRPVDGTVFLASNETEVTATGSEEFLIAVAQQLSWLAAACRTSDVGLAYSHIDLTNTPQEGNIDHPIFQIEATVELPASAEQKGCWNVLAGSSVLVAGFPIPGRHHAERGLESHLGILSSLVGIRQAVTYRGGYVLKGRFHALVPIDKTTDSVQWHLIDTSPRKLRWADIDKLCPSRVLGVEYKDLKALQAAKAFLGWCPRVKNILGTKYFDYTAVRYSKAAIPSRTRLNISEFSFGVNKIVSASVKFTLGKKDGVYERDRSDYYEGLLDDARDTHVFLYDAKNRCTFHADAERVILQIILHAHNKSPYIVDGKPAYLSDPGTTLDEHAVRHTMLANANSVLKHEIRPKESEPLKLLFRDRVQQLYETIHGFQGHSASNTVALSMESSTTILGWEYMDLVSDKRSMKLKEAKLLKTCGQWPSFVTDEDINGVILLGQDFGEILQPADALSTCSSYRVVPKGMDYLAIQNSTLIDLFEEHGSAEDQERLTSSGLSWHCPSLLFGSCQNPTNESEGCRCDRVQEFILPRRRLDPRQLLQPKIRKPGPLEEDGAVIFGSSSIKNSVIKRIGLVGRRSGIEQDSSASEVTIAATSSNTEVASFEEDDSSLPIWAKSATETQSPKCRPLSQWHIPEPGLPVAYASSLCASESSTNTSCNTSRSSTFSASGLNSEAPKSNSTSIPERSEQGSKISSTSFTRPGVSFAAVAALRSYPSKEDTSEKSPKAAFLPMEKPRGLHLQIERRPFSMATIWQSLDDDTLTTTQRTSNKQVTYQPEIRTRNCNGREGFNIDVIQDMDHQEALARPEVAYKPAIHDSTMTWRHLPGNHEWGIKARNISHQANFGLTGGDCRQVLRRKRNFIRPVV